MNISKITALIEPLLMEDLPDCSEPRDVELSDEDNISKDKLPSITNFDKKKKNIFSANLDLIQNMRQINLVWK